tara:strand:- start:1212 stop:1562 length:351 start_codon:yes stop_codon:yes gene_type:complete
MIKNKIHYQITGDLTADYGVTVTNPIIKIAQAASDGQILDSGELNFEYNIYISNESYTDGKYFFKAEKDGKRLINFSYPVADVPTWSLTTYAEDQRKIIADTFGLDISNVVLVEEE